MLHRSSRPGFGPIYVDAIPQDRSAPLFSWVADSRLVSCWGSTDTRFSEVIHSNARLSDWSFIATTLLDREMPARDHADSEKHALTGILPSWKTIEL